MVGFARAARVRCAHRRERFRLLMPRPGRKQKSLKLPRVPRRRRRRVRGRHSADRLPSRARADPGRGARIVSSRELIGIVGEERVDAEVKTGGNSARARSGTHSRFQIPVLAESGWAGTGLARSTGVHEEDPATKPRRSRRKPVLYFKCLLRGLRVFVAKDAASGQPHASKQPGDVLATHSNP